jgi:hypothetical protein
MGIRGCGVLQRNNRVKVIVFDILAVDEKLEPVTKVE